MDAEERELYELLLELDALEEILEDLTNHGVQSLGQLEQRLSEDVIDEELVQMIQRLRASGIETVHDVERLLAELEATIAEPSAPGTDWYEPN